jgi:hypothetical protein
MAVLSLGWMPRAHAQQPEATVLGRLANGSYVVVIGADTLLAITRTTADSSLKAMVDLEAAREEIEQKDTLYARTQNTLQDSLATLNREIADKYKQLSDDPWLSFQAGLGATGEDRNPAVMVGVGIKRVRVWGFFQEDNAGALLGVNLTVF